MATAACNYLKLEIKGPFPILKASEHLLDIDETDI